MRNRIARNTVKERTQAIATIQGAMRNRIARDKTIKHFEDQVARVENMISSTRSNFNEQRLEGLRKAKKALQDRRSELINRAPKMNRILKTDELRKININESHYDNVILKQKPGPKVKERIKQFEGAAFTPKRNNIKNV